MLDKANAYMLTVDNFDNLMASNMYKPYFQLNSQLSLPR